MYKKLFREIKLHKLSSEKEVQKVNKLTRDRESKKNRFIESSA